MHENPAHLKQLEDWLRSYKPEELFDKNGRLIPELKALAPKGTAPHERQSSRQWGLAAEASAHAGLPRLCHQGGKTRAGLGGEHASPGLLPARYHAPEHDEFPRLRPRRKQLEQARCDL